MCAEEIKTGRIEKSDSAELVLRREDLRRELMGVFLQKALSEYGLLFTSPEAYSHIAKFAAQGEAFKDKISKDVHEHLTSEEIKKQKKAAIFVLSNQLFSVTNIVENTQTKEELDFLDGIAHALETTSATTTTDLYNAFMHRWIDRLTGQKR